MSVVINAGHSIDINTPLNARLCPFYRRSRPFHSVRERLPAILSQIIDVMVRNKEAIIKRYANNAAGEFENVIDGLKNLKQEIETNQLISYITVDSPDTKIYNKCLDIQAGNAGQPCYFSSIWLFTQCYMYRRIRQVFELTSTLRSYDPFKPLKDEALRTAQSTCVQTGKYFFNILSSKDCSSNKIDFINLLKLDLWGNKCDLCQSLGVVTNVQELSVLQALEPNILCDHSERIWEIAADVRSASKIIDMVLDNAGYELFTDLCLADFMITRKYAKQIRIYVKKIPWYISDTMTADIHWALEQLRSNDDATLKALGARWVKYFENKTWTIEEHDFWTLPVEFSMMAKIEPDLYKKLGEAKLVIFKGDLNYRKSMGDINWYPETPLETALRGFRPSNMCLLRTMKTAVIAGLDAGVAKKAEAVDQKWLILGDYGIIQLCEIIT